MPSLPYNIEKSAFHRGEYVGYAAGYVFRITKSHSSYGTWAARLARFNPVNPALSNRIFFAFSLGRTYHHGDEIEFRPYGSCTVVFITFQD